MSLRDLAKWISASAPSKATVAILERVLRPRSDSLHVLTYHRVAPRDERPDLHPALLSATPAAFREQIDYLASTGRVVSLEDVLAAFRGERRLVAGAILITFDDAYADFAEHAWPVLAKYRLPVTLFVPTAYPDQPERHFWWDRLHAAFHAAEPRDAVETVAGTFRLHDSSERAAARRAVGGKLQTLDHAVALATVDKLCEELEAPPPIPAVLGWSELLDLHRAGVTLAAHTRTHPLLAKIPLEHAISETEGSFDDLVERVGHAPAALAYPGGSHTDALVRALRDSRFEIAFTTRRGSNKIPSSSPLRLDRINVGHRSTLPLVRAQLLPVAP
ncbi:MAG: polysaccharide deacetylase family protein [Gaiellaceae bacterium]